jgi:proline iminopeptidase
MYDPEFYRIVYMHQRGSGYSTPLGETRENTTWHLVDDIERLRKHLGIERWLVTGGSWGSALSLAYAEAHPDRCAALLVRGIFLGRPEDLAWFFHAPREVFPEVANRFFEFLPEEERADFRAAYGRRIMSEDRDVYLPACRAWAAYETSFFKLIPDPKAMEAGQDEIFAVPYARMNIHYFSNDCFLNEKPILDNIAGIRHIPCTIIHGRYDLSVPVRMAMELKDAMPDAELMIPPDAGHAGSDRSNVAACIEAQEKLKRVF